MLLYVFISIVVLYSLLILSFTLGFSLVKPPQKHTSSPGTRFSILVPFRDEEAHLPALIKSLDEMDYPKRLFEVIFINDDSIDDSVELSLRLLTSSSIDFRIIDATRKSNSPKKDAIETAISLAKYPWIITTDADCTVPELWLQECHNFIITSDIKMLVAPVTYTSSFSPFNQFQLLDMLSLQGATIGGFGLRLPFLCNGANFIYKKALFITLNGFDGNDNIASGDDVFLLEKALKKYPKQVKYLKSKEAIVTTRPQPSLHGLIQQRVRWAAKGSAYNNLFGKGVGLLILLMNAAVLAAFFLSFIGVFNVLYSIGLLILKLGVDYLLLYRSADFFNQLQSLRYYIFSAVFYPFFSTFVATYAMFNGYKWKGRYFKK